MESMWQSTRERSVDMVRKYFFLLGFLLILWGCQHCPDLVSNDEIRGQDIHPYVGLIRNFSSLAVSIPSHDSSATLILPPQGQMEFTVWKPNFDIYGYVDGKQVYFKNITINRNKKFSYFGKSYDFLAEVCPDLTAPMILPQQCPSFCPVEPEPPSRIKPCAPRKVCPG
jgi:hypothetical protein